MIDTAAGSAAKVRGDRHLEIDTSIESIESLIYGMQELLTRIRNQGEMPCGGNVSAPHELPSLSQLLDGGANRIDGKCKELHGLIGEISSELF